MKVFGRGGCDRKDVWKFMNKKSLKNIRSVSYTHLDVYKRQEVSSTLNNRLLARGYYNRVSELSMMLAANASNGHAGEADVQDDQTAKDRETKQSNPAFNIHAVVQDYGLIGLVTLEII